MDAYCVTKERNVNEVALLCHASSLIKRLDFAFGFFSDHLITL